MEPDRWARIKEVFGAALEREPGQRAEVLEQACRGDKTLREEVESLLESHETTKLTQLTGNLSPASSQAPESEASEAMERWRIGPYQIILEIGHGGMATVYLADRADDQYRKRVAIKLVKSGLGTEEILRRFRHERQTLAALDHSYIVKLLDGGSTEQGLPYLVMEYVEGVPIDEYCDQRRLNVTERLRLFGMVCAGLQYAHQNLVIHRDLKPANILVTADGIPKLLDFGIAKLLNPEVSAQSLLVTQPSVRLMTPQYASPEQIRGQSMTTATDIYSLGVILYELLTGHRPYRLKSYTPLEIERAICDQEPERPSTIVTVEEAARSAGENTEIRLTPERVSLTREGRPEKLRRRLSGDLDNIILMALRKEPPRRYASVEQFSADIRRHLDGLPVTARPATLFYRSSKFVRRNRTAVVAAALVILALVAGIIATTREARAVRVEKLQAERRFNDVHQLADFFLFQFDDAIKNLPGSTPARKLIVQKALEYLSSLARDSAQNRALQRDLVQAYIKVGDVQGMPYRPNLGDVTGALDSYRKAQAIAVGLTHSNPRDAEAVRGFGHSELRIGGVLLLKGQAKQAVEHLRRAAAAYESLSLRESANSKDRLGLGNCYDSLGDALGHKSFLDLRDPAAALENYRKALAISEAIATAEPANVQARHDAAVEYAKIGDNLLESGDVRSAIDYERKALAALEAISTADPANAVARRELSVVYNKLANALWEANQRDEPIRLYRQALRICEELVRADPTNALLRFDLAVGYRNVGDVLLEQKDISGAIDHYRKAIALVEQISATDPSNILRRLQLAEALITLGSVLFNAGQKEEARRFTIRGLDIERTLAMRPEATPGEAKNYALALLTCQPSDLRNPAAALRVAKQAAEMSKASDPQILDVLAQAYFESGNPSDAVEAERKAVALIARGDAGSPPSVLRKELEANLAKFEKGLRRR